MLMQLMYFTPMCSTYHEQEWIMYAVLCIHTLHVTRPCKCRVNLWWIIYLSNGNCSDSTPCKYMYMHHSYTFTYRTYSSFRYRYRSKLYVGSCKSLTLQRIREIVWFSELGSSSTWTAYNIPTDLRKREVFCLSFYLF